MTIPLQLNSDQDSQSTCATAGAEGGVGTKVLPKKIRIFLGGKETCRRRTTPMKPALKRVSTIAKVKTCHAT
jgi:hypothetical protein